MTCMNFRYPSAGAMNRIAGELFFVSFPTSRDSVWDWDRHVRIPPEPNFSLICRYRKCRLPPVPLPFPTRIVDDVIPLGFVDSHLLQLLVYDTRFKTNYELITVEFNPRLDKATVVALCKIPSAVPTHMHPIFKGGRQPWLLLTQEEGETTITVYEVHEFGVRKKCAEFNPHRECVFAAQYARDLFLVCKPNRNDRGTHPRLLSYALDAMLVQSQDAYFVPTWSRRDADDASLFNYRVCGRRLYTIHKHEESAVSRFDMQRRRADWEPCYYFSPDYNFLTTGEVLMGDGSSVWLNTPTLEEVALRRIHSCMPDETRRKLKMASKVNSAPKLVAFLLGSYIDV